MLEICVRDRYVSDMAAEAMAVMYDDYLGNITADR